MLRAIAPKRYCLSLWSLMTTFYSPMGTVVKPLAGKSKALVDATARRFLVVGAVLRQVPIAMDNYVKSLTSKPLLATIVWGMDETYQWVSMKAHAGTPSLSEFLCKAAVPWLSASVESFYICSFLVIVLGARARTTNPARQEPTSNGL